MDERCSLYVKLVLATAFWGGTFIAGRVAASTLEPSVIAFLRFLAASILLAAFLTFSRESWTKLNWRQLALVLGGGLTGIVAYNMFFFSGLKIIEANRASLIVALNPAAIMITAGLLGMERMTGQRAAGILVALLGVWIVLSNGRVTDIDGSLGTGEIFILGCVVAWVAYTIIGRTLVQEFSPLQFTTYSSIAGCLGLSIPALMSIRTGVGFRLDAILAILFLGVFGTALAFVWYYDGVKNLGPTRAGIFINLVPVWGVLLSTLLLAERIPVTSILGGMVILVGVLLTNHRLRPAHPSLSQ
jgi:drug/metabolite transporter (DMT)-like permease